MNIVVYLILGFLYVFSTVGGFDSIFLFIHDQFTIPPKFAEFITRPWTIVTYAFAHDLRGILHILFNMLLLYWFGKLVVEFLGNDRFIALYFLGAIAGGVAYLLVYNLIPFYIDRSGTFPGMIGASAAVYAVVLGAATNMPNHTMFLIFFGPVRIKYIAAIGVVLSFLGSAGSNAGGNIAHLGGAFIGYIYILQMRKV